MISKSNYGFLIISEEDVEERYGNLDHNGELEITDEIGQQSLQPSISDPKLWLIKCRINKERDCVNNLFHKYFGDKTVETKYYKH